MENTVKYGVKNSVKVVNSHSPDTVKNGVKTVKFTTKECEKVRRIKDCKRIYDKTRECLITIGLILLFLVVTYLQQAKWQVSFICFFLAVIYALWHDVLNFFLHISDRTRKYMCVSVGLIAGGIAGIGQLPFGLSVLMALASILIMKFAYVNDDIYFFQESEQEEKEERNLIERQERYIFKVEQELQKYIRLENSRQEEVEELQSMLESYEEEVEELKKSNNELLKNYKAEQGYNESLQEINNRYKNQIQQLEEIINNQPKAENDTKCIEKDKKDKEIATETIEEDISERDLKILNYLDNTELSYRRIGELLGISYGTVKNVKKKYRPDTDGAIPS